MSGHKKEQMQICGAFSFLLFLVVVVVIVAYFVSRNIDLPRWHHCSCIRMKRLAYIDKSWYFENCFQPKIKLSKRFDLMKLFHGQWTNARLITPFNSTPNPTPTRCHETVHRQCSLIALPGNGDNLMIQDFMGWDRSDSLHRDKANVPITTDL